MAPTLPEAAKAMDLSKRYYYYSCDPDNESCSWYYWGRWVFAGIVVIFFIVLFAVWGCISSRRRRRRGVAPMYGTGWMAPPKYPGPPGQGAGTYQPPPPAYGAPPGAPPAAHPQNPQYTGTSFSPSQGYYGQQQGIAMQPQVPQGTYQRAYDGSGAHDDYAPPAGPPPGK